MVIDTYKIPNDEINLDFLAGCNINYLRYCGNNLNINPTGVDQINAASLKQLCLTNCLFIPIDNFTNLEYLSLHYVKEVDTY